MTVDCDVIMTRDGDLTCPMHINPELEVVIAEGGTVTVYSEGKSYVLRDGEATVILPYRLHAFATEPDTASRVYMFPFSLSEELYEGYSCRGFTENPFRLSPSAAAYLKEALSSYGLTGGASTMKSIFYTFISEFLKNNEPLATEAHTPNTVRRITEYIYDNLTEPLTPNGTAGALGITRRALGEVLNQYTGMTFTAFIRNIRIEKAMRLLLHGELNVTETAYACGFGTLRSFNRAFLDALGCTPSDYRRRNGANRRK